MRYSTSDDGDLTALRYDDWKLIFMEQRETGTLLWQILSLHLEFL